MSTKTNFKRIALVAIAALGLSVLSSVPSQATIEGTPTVTVVNGTAGITGQRSDSTTAATLSIRYFAATTADTANVTLTLGTTTGTSNYTLGSGTNLRVTSLDTSSSTGDTTTTPAKTSADSQIATTLPTIAATAGSFAEAKFGVHLDSSAAGTRGAGTYTINYIVKFFDAGSTGQATTKTVTGTVNIVVTDGAAAAAGSVAASGTSTALMYAGTTWVAPTGNVDSSVSVPATPDGTVRAVIRVTQLTAAGLPARESVTVTTSLGNIGSGGTASGKSVTFIGNANGINDIQVFSDGSGGTAVVTIKTTSVTFANKAVTFYGTTIATITVTQLLTTIGGTSSNVLVATAKDAAGATVRTADGVYIYSSDANVINTGTAPAGTSCGTYQSAYSGYLCAVTGSNNGTANLTVRDKSTSTLSTVASAATAVKVNTASPATVVLSFDKATYAPGEVAYITIKPLDAAKAAIGATTFANLFATNGITSSIAFGNGSATVAELGAVSVTTAGRTVATDGIASSEAISVFKVYMPASGGVVTIKAKGGASLPSSGQVDVTATATVTDNASAALAAVTALATTVASLKTLITTLTNLVLKIQKKVKA